VFQLKKRAFAVRISVRVSIPESGVFGREIARAPASNFSIQLRQNIRGIPGILCH
jgi:hypothetical protein